MERASSTFAMSTMPAYLDQESMGWMEGYFRASDRSRERPWKAPTTFSVALGHGLVEVAAGRGDGAADGDGGG